MSEHPNPYVFVTGCARSGTTLLQRLLDGHSQLAVGNDTHVVPRSVIGADAGPQLRLTKELVEEVIGFKRFDHLGVDEHTARSLAAGSETFVEFARALFGEFARRQGKPYAGEKDPEYVRRLPLIHRLFPSARSIQIFRDGRDVALSTLEWVTPTRFLGRLPLWREEPVAVCALWWRRQVSAGRRGRDEVGADRCLEVRYEELVEEPEPVLESITRFLELSFDPAMLEYHVGKTRRDPELPSKQRWLPPTRGLRDWRSQLSARDLELFETLAGDLLTALGYPRTTDHVGPQITELAERCRARWTIEVARAAASADRRPVRA